MDNGGKISPRGARSGIRLSSYQLQDVSAAVAPQDGDVLEYNNGQYTVVSGPMSYRLNAARSTSSTTETSLFGVGLAVSDSTFYNFRIQLYVYFISGASYYLKLHLGTGAGTGATAIYQVTSTGLGGSAYTTYGNSTAATQITDTPSAAGYRYLIVEGQLGTGTGATVWTPGMSISAGGPGISLSVGSLIEVRRTPVSSNGGAWS